MRVEFGLAFLVACSSPSGMPAGSEVDASTGGDASTSIDAPPASATCDGKQPQPRDATWMVSVGSVQRVARVHVPASYDPATRTPVVINLHGRTHNGTGHATLSHAIAKSDAAGFIAVHPESSTSPTSWNTGGGCCDPAAAQNVDDSGFIGKLLDDLESKLCVDADRVYVMGLSNGGYLAHRIGCEHADRIAAIGGVAGLLSLPTCAPSRPMPTWLVHGTADTLVSYDWLDETVHYWKVTNGCTTSMQTYQNGDTRCVTESGCTAGADVTWCTVTDGGHQWPGGETVPFLGKKTNDIIATDALWDFFVAHPRP